MSKCGGMTLAFLGTFALAASAAAQPDTLIIEGGKVGIGIPTPQSLLHVVSPGDGVELMLELEATGLGGRPRLTFTNPDGVWFYEINGERFEINRSGTGPPDELRLDPSGDLTIGGALTELSSRTAKTELVVLDPGEVLTQVVELPVVSWRYREDREKVRHVGPMAEEFYAAFGLGDAGHIAPSDKAGIALLAIQGLHRELAKRDSRVEELVREKADLEERVSRLERLLESSQAR